MSNNYSHHLDPSTCSPIVQCDVVPGIWRSTLASQGLVPYQALINRASASVLEGLLRVKWQVLVIRRKQKAVVTVLAQEHLLN